MRVIFIFVFLIIISTSAFPFSDQTTTERILGENREFIEFMNICTTNFGKGRIENINEKFKTIYQYHFNGQVGYLQSDYKNAFYHVRESQRNHVNLCAEVIEKIYLEDSKSILDKIAPEIIKSKNARARLYLTLGYRDRAVGRNFQTIADASNPKLYSYKIFRYIEGIKMARRAKRYGFLALYESRDNKTKRDIFYNLLEEENKRGNKFYTRFAKKGDKEIIDEMKKDHEQIEQWEKNNLSAQTAQNTSKEESVESNVDRRVRHRKENIVAKHLLYSEFERAEEVIREYVKDFNFKLILSTLKVMSKQSGEIDYNSYFVHHFDNYARVFDIQKSLTEGEEGNRTLLDELIPHIRVVGDLKREMIEEDVKKIKSGTQNEKKEESTAK
ncbi:MAG: hypothetical protein N2316_02425 [Spirochaetes bacterium]|nr:hypothetical protein [Spirochaetota bacterium]